MVLVGSVEDVSEVDEAVLVDAVPVEAVLDDVVPDEALDAPDVLAWRSTNSFCRAELKLDPLLLVELTAPVLLASVLEEEVSDVGELNEVLLVLSLLLLPEILL